MLEMDDHVPAPQDLVAIVMEPGGKPERFVERARTTNVASGKNRFRALPHGHTPSRIVRAAIEDLVTRREIRGDISRAFLASGPIGVATQHALPTTSWVSTGRRPGSTTDGSASRAGRTRGSRRRRIG